MCRQAEAVGGDFFDFLALPHGEVGFVIGDVCGKGVSAALMMANLLAMLRTEARHLPVDPASLIATANRLFYEASFADFYCTLFYAVFDPLTRSMRYVNAGHFPPLVVKRDGLNLQWLVSGGAPVGVFHSSHYEVGSIDLSPGDFIVAYTDGVIESQNRMGDEWGVERLVQIARSCKYQTAIQLSASIVEAVDTFSAGVEQHDDMTLLVLRAR
jgi:sigma-B regulation protein RsbU (phosphoserine phosphatase)